MCLYGRPFEIETDHRSLEHINEAKANSPGKPTPARIERWRLRLQEYDFTVTCRPGTRNLADSLSRLPKTLSQLRSTMESCADRYVHYLAEHMTPRAMTVHEIQHASMDDKELTQFRDLIRSNQLYSLPTHYKAFAEELCITDQDILLR